MALVLIYVDDMLITGNSILLIEETKNQLKQAFKMKDLGELRYFLGIEFGRSKQGILMHQRKYALELISETGLTAAKPAGTLIDTNLKLTTKQYDEETQMTKDDPLTDQGAYQRIVGKLLYLTMIRPDIFYGVQILSQFLQQPKKPHMTTTLRIVRYVKNPLGQGLILSSYSKNTITAYCDADWASFPLTKRLITGYFVQYGGSLVSWKSKK
ncbi:uncharacterized mitochondrial protein AtMg00810-like [Solanum stenotomum]|uniref:uncharacterized mitochondrial protein AtMg00810-like n=1 Tax=Solanum stenotomum TaxID=172797 RepID=UPI0020D0B4BB|nr:uncharacterized mitochondrial protein AtMg00810-like [Solanum stenotomum]